VHLATIWAAAIGVNLSAFFIIAANSFMQHPVGTKFNPATGRAELESIWAVVTNSTGLWAFPHTVTASFVTSATFMAGIAGWWTVRATRAGDLELAKVYRPALRLGLGVLLVSGIGVAITGDGQAKLMFDQQPMKMASAEGLCETRTGAAFSLLSVGGLSNDCHLTDVLVVPKLTSFLATNDPNATVKGVNDLKAEQVATYGDDGVGGASYVPPLGITYWSFRLMIGLGAFSAALALAGLWLTRKGATPTGRTAERFAKLAVIALPTPIPGQHRRLGVHRDGPPTLDRGPQPHRRCVRAPDRHLRGVPVRRRPHRGDLPDRVHPPLRRSRRRLVRPDPPAHPPGRPRTARRQRPDHRHR